MSDQPKPQAPPRLAPIAPEEGARRAAELGLPLATGRLLAFRVVANHPALARGMFTQHASLRHDGLLADRLRELIIMRVAWRCASAYEWSQHWAIATHLGIPSADLTAVRDWRAASCFDAVERAVLALVDDTFDLGAASETNWNTALGALGDPLCVLEVVAAAIHWTGLATLFASLNLPLEECAALWPPDGKAPPPRSRVP